MINYQGKRNIKKTLFHTYRYAITFDVISNISNKTKYNISGGLK